MTKKCLIISGGEFCPVEPPVAGTFVIACDRGYEYALRCGIRPDMVVGDFDSYSGPLPEDIPVERHRPEKDDTDTMLAVRLALEQGCQEIELCCALGGRLDHALANLQTAVFAAVHGAELRIRDARTDVRVLLPGRLLLPRREGWALSLFSLGDECRGLSVRGVKYPLENARLSNAFPLGVSNEWAGEQAEIELGSGTLLVVMAKC